MLYLQNPEISRKLTVTLVEMQQLQDVDKADSKD